jgi:hypothetical protein
LAFATAAAIKGKPDQKFCPALAAPERHKAATVLTNQLNEGKIQQGGLEQLWPWGFGFGDSHRHRSFIS